MEKAELFGRIYQKFGGQWSDANQTQLVKDVIALQEFEEQKGSVWESLSTTQNMWHSVVRRKQLGSIHDQLKDINKNISAAGFDYAAVHKRSFFVEDEHVYDRMRKKHTNEEVEEAIRIYVDAEDMLAHQKTQKIRSYSSSFSSSELDAAKRVTKDLRAL